MDDKEKIILLKKQMNKLRETIEFIFYLDDNVRYGSKEYFEMLSTICEDTLNNDDKFRENSLKSI